MMFKNMDILFKDEELRAIWKEYEDLGIIHPCYNYDEYSGITDYKNKLRERLEREKKKLK